jgi:uncharacterized protein YjbJ (UPF0337 family)
MFKLPEFPSIDFSRLDINALRSIDVSKYLPNLDASTVEAGKFTAALRDAAYATVGLGALAFDQAQTRRRQLVAALSERFGASKAQVDTLLAVFEAQLTRMDEQVAAVEARIDAVVDKLEGVLPEQAGALIGQARDFGKGARKQVRGLIRTAA